MINNICQIFPLLYILYYNINLVIFDYEVENLYNMQTNSSFMINEWNDQSNVRYTTNLIPTYFYTSDSNTLFIFGPIFKIELLQY